LAKRDAQGDEHRVGDHDDPVGDGEDPDAGVVAGPVLLVMVGVVPDGATVRGIFLVLVLEENGQRRRRDGRFLRGRIPVTA